MFKYEIRYKTDGQIHTKQPENLIQLLKKWMHCKKLNYQIYYISIEKVGKHNGK